MVIHRNYLDILSKVGSMEAVRKARFVDPPLYSRDHTWKRQVQKTMYNFFAAQAMMDPASRTREKYDHWQPASRASTYALPGSVRQLTPNWQACSEAWLLRQLKAPVPARVHASVLSAMWNRWCTAMSGRMRQ